MKHSISIIMVAILLSSCAPTYESKHTCQNNQAAAAGGFLGGLAGFTIGGGWGQAAGTAGGIAVGRLAGMMVEKAEHIGQPDDAQPYKHSWYGDCEPVNGVAQ
jgi:uncharacterized protein YcfJ